MNVPSCKALPRRPKTLILTLKPKTYYERTLLQSIATTT